ncbi:MAG: molybdate transporter substrate-binding protein [Pseudomonadota bacterium]|jgi:molybdate transport system substrate-binding protein
MHRARSAHRILALLVMSLATHCLADEVSVAVAANFAAPMKVLAQQFKRETGHTAVLAFGSTGQFHAQIRHGAPFHVLLAADTRTPLRIEQEGQGVHGTRMTYAIGRLVLWSRTPGLIDPNGSDLNTARIKRLAVAHPKLAPYGTAALEVLEALGRSAAFRPRIVEGANIAQTFQFVVSGNAEAGFVALSQVFAEGRLRAGSGWVVPEGLHAPIRQDAIVLRSGQGHAAAHALMQFLKSEDAAAVIRSFGYQR